MKTSNLLKIALAVIMGFVIYNYNQDIDIEKQITNLEESAEQENQ